MEFKGRILLIQSIAAIFIALCCVLITLFAINSVLTNDKFHESHNIATAIALNPDIAKATKNTNVAKLDELLRKKKYPLAVDFIVIAGKDGKRLFHTDPKKEGGYIQDKNFSAVLNGQVITKVRQGLSGLTINTRMPIYYNNTIVGVASVGFLQQHVDNLIYLYLFQAALVIIILLLLMLYGSNWFSNYIQKKLSGMSPSQIAQAYQLRKGILNSVAEGVIAVDIHGITMVINHQATKILGIEKAKEELFGKPITQYCYPSEFFSPKLGEETIAETTININGETLLASRTIMEDADNIIGYVVSFRRRNATAILQLMANQIAKERDDLRAITHEYANNVAVVSGMLEMGLVDKAKAFIHKESHALQEDISQLTTNFHSLIAALILSKKRRAHELGFMLTIIDGSSLSLERSPLSPNEIAAILGNLLDNAYEAIAKTNRKGKIELFATDFGHEIIIEVSDNGIGIADERKNQIFIDGYTSKSDLNLPHGVGLALIENLTHKAHGQIIVEDNDQNGTIFSLFIPKTVESV